MNNNNNFKNNQVNLFCGKPEIPITNPNIREAIKSKMLGIGVFSFTAKYYDFLNVKKINCIKEGDFKVALSTFGKKMILFLTRYNEKKYCIFINKKNESMNIAQFCFSDELFDGTLIIGELNKTNSQNWVFNIFDLAFYKGTNLITKGFEDRQQLIDDMLKYEYSYTSSQPCYLSKKKYFPLNNIQDLVENMQHAYDYISAGLYFKSTTNFSDNYLFIFPEHRTDSKILNNGYTVDNQQIVIKDAVIGGSLKKAPTANNTNSLSINNSSNPKKTVLQQQKQQYNMTNNQTNNQFNNPTSIFGDVDMQIQSDDDDSTSDDVFKNDDSDWESDDDEEEMQNTCHFMIHPTGLPDVYELYCKSNTNSPEKHSVASVPGLGVSQMLKDWMKDQMNMTEDAITKINIGKAIYTECKYHRIFKKWIPIKKSNRMDSLQKINQVQILLDASN